MERLVEVRLSEPEWQFSRGVTFYRLRSIVSTADLLPYGAYLLRIPRQCIEEFRDALTEGLAKTGFAKSYEPTDDGRMLEDLIDRLFVP